MDYIIIWAVVIITWVFAMAFALHIAINNAHKKHVAEDEKERKRMAMEDEKERVKVMALRESMADKVSKLNSEKIKKKKCVCIDDEGCE
jgi:hypothetical protein